MRLALNMEGISPTNRCQQDFERCLSTWMTMVKFGKIYNRYLLT